LTIFCYSNPVGDISLGDDLANDLGLATRCASSSCGSMHSNAKSISRLLRMRRGKSATPNGARAFLLPPAETVPPNACRYGGQTKQTASERARTVVCRYELRIVPSLS